ncbi:hypothetical protein MKJ04_05580 [Pontibacter sp. E15-1]|uniref:hypothetical protein n=1 Tax=Pontibacter sp. E15-1 TaxID=2919918 RepID=UPI001F502FCC|nr:hypothetical protein [Pontibacter sp. E15-1]MCJ8164306.1 hypothetical protein [Pontibacter sp. E15-1]
MKLLDQKINKYRKLDKGVLIHFASSAGRRWHEPTQAVQKQVDSEGEWQPLFNGKDIVTWIVKIYRSTVRVEDDLLKVSYDGYSKFKEV